MPRGVVALGIDARRAHRHVPAVEAVDESSHQGLVLFRRAHRRLASHVMRTRITEMLGIEYPIVQAPMGFIARAQLASAVANAGGSASSKRPQVASTRCRPR